MLNISSVPILTITLRNNLMEVLPIKKWLSGSNNSLCQFMLQDDRKIVKGVWSILLNLPVVLVVVFERNPQIFVTYTGGICGTFILLVFPAILIYHVRMKKLEETFGRNFNKSPFQHIGWTILVFVFAAITLICVITGLILTGGSTGH